MMTMIDGWLVAVIFENDVCDVCGVRPRNHTTVCSHSCVTQHIVSSGDVRVVWSLSGCVVGCSRVWMPPSE